MDIPNLLKWLNHGGTLRIVGKDNNVVEVSLGDAGGGGVVETFSSSEEALKRADALARIYINDSEQLINEFKSGIHQWPEEGYLNIPGIGKVYRDK